MEELIVLLEPLIPFAARLIGAVFIYMLTDNVKKKTKVKRKPSRKTLKFCSACASEQPEHGP